MKSTQQSDCMDEHRVAGESPRTEESSVTFSLSALIAMESDPARLPSAARTSGDDRSDSGLIDLAALIAGEQPASSDLLDIFPFGAPPASGAQPMAQGAPTPDDESTLAGVDTPAGARAHGPRARSAAALLAVAAGAAALVAGLAARQAPHGPPAAAGIAQAARSLNVPSQPAAPPAPAARGGRPDERTPASAGLGAVAARSPSQGRPRTSGAVSPAHPDSARPPAQHLRHAGSASPLRAPQPDRDRAAARNRTERRAPADPCNGDLTCAMRRATGG
jgi:hypothetical protein